MMDALREYFRNTYGITKIPLLYVVREQEAPMDEPKGHWKDPMIQMIDRAPHWVPAAGGGEGSVQSIAPVMWLTTRWCSTN